MENITCWRFLADAMVLAGTMCGAIGWCLFDLPIGVNGNAEVRRKLSSLNFEGQPRSQKSLRASCQLGGGPDVAFGTSGHAGRADGCPPLGGKQTYQSTRKRPPVGCRSVGGLSSGAISCCSLRISAIA